MEEGFDYWEFLAGIGLFLWGMSQLEQAIRQLGGNSFKNLLHRFTDKSWKGILAGTGITAILQSSSLVTLMVLAFLGGGMISLRNSLGVVLGANLGTTFTAWIVATFGFKISVSDFAFPFLAIGVMTYLFMNSRPFLKNSGIFLLGFGLLFLGLDYMKLAIEGYAAAMDLSALKSYGLWVYLITGIIITVMIQSSSAMIVIVLSAVNAQMIGTDHALAMVIGANIGTTFTLILGAFDGSADKKRLALANLMFNLIAGLFCFFWIDQLIYLTMHWFNIMDPLMELVILNSLINLIMILGFFPFLPTLERWLVKKFKADVPKGRSRYIKNVPLDVPSVAVLAFEKELDWVLKDALKFVRKIINKHKGPKKDASVWKKITYQPRDLLQDYQNLKNLEEELYLFVMYLQEKKLSLNDAALLGNLTQTLRSLVVGAKEFKDIVHNLVEMENAEEPFVTEILESLQSEVKDFLTVFEEYLAMNEANPEIIQSVKEKLKSNYSTLLQLLYTQLKARKTDVSISTMANVIQQVFSGLELIWEGIASIRKQEIEAVSEN